MNSATEKFEKAIAAFDAYNTKDPNREEYLGQSFPKELLYAQRMTERLSLFAPNADVSVKLAVRCQHIGRWEIARSNYPMDKKGYLQWRNAEKVHHAKIAEGILANSGYDAETVAKVKSLVLKKELFTNADTQLLEDVVCLVFIEHYLEEFAAKHDATKVIDIIRKTAKKMSKAALEDVKELSLTENVKSLLQQALSPPLLFKFEEEFMEDRIRCLPMVVRFKLDACGIKLKLSEWNNFTVDERKGLMEFSTTTDDEIRDYRMKVQKLVLHHTGKEATELPIEKLPAWVITEELQKPLLEKLKEFGWTISLQQWKELSDMQRFVLVKLSRPSHENKNFPKAVKEFGLVGID
jgi:hypothetical protein